MSSIKTILKSVGIPIVTEGDKNALKRLESKLQWRRVPQSCGTLPGIPPEYELIYRDLTIGGGSVLSMENGIPTYKHAACEFILTELYQIELNEEKKFLTEHLLNSNVIIREYTKQRIEELNEPSR